MSGKRVLSAGQCAADNWSVRTALKLHFPVEVTEASTTAEALAKLRAESFDLVLLNRVFDRDGTSGLDVIRRLKSDEKLRSVPVMLVSNYEDAQQQAVHAGAVPGFGKAELGRETMVERLKAFLA